MTIGSGIQVILRSQQSERQWCLMGGIYRVCLEMASCGMISIPRFMKIGVGIQSVLRFCFINLRCCSVGITDGGEI
jgi:hypothetical protein